MKTIPMDERTITDLEVFSAFNSELPALKHTFDALNSGDTAEAKKSLVHYFMERKNVHYFYDYRALPLTPIDTDTNPHDFQAALGLSGSLKEFCLYAGKQLMNHIYVRPGRDRTTIDLGKNYENLPHFNFLTDLGKKQRTLSDIFVRGQLFEYLSVLYHETGDSKVLDKFEEVLQMFFDNYPLVLEYTKADASRFCLSEDRDVMSTGWLILSYTSLLYTRIPYEIDADLSFEIIKRIWFLGIQFNRFETDGYRKYNHHMWERGLIPYMLSVIYPEIPAFAPMKERGADIIRQHILDDFNESGGYSEHSIPYWSGAALCEMLYRGIYLSETNAIPLLDEECQRRLSATFDALALICPPQELYTSIGDNGGPMVNPVLTIGSKSVNNEYCRQVLNLRQNSSLPHPNSLPLDYSNDRCGFFASRSGFGPNSNFLLMSAKVDCKDSGHNHMDMLSLSISFRGQEFIGEPHARQLYQRCRMNTSQRGYLYNMGSHNTVLAHGKPVQPDEMYANKWGVYRPDSPISAFKSTKDGCYVEAYHDAYTTCRHNRHILFHRKKGLVLLDRMEHGNRMPDAHIQRWHVTPDTNINQLTPQSLVLEKQGVRLLFVWENTPFIRIWQKEDLRPEIVKNEEPLSTIIDAAFAPGAEKAEDIAEVSQLLLILDITERKQDTLDQNQLIASARKILTETDLSASLEQFNLL